MGLSWSDDALEDRMVKGWAGGLKDGTPCGGGSTRASARNVVQELPKLCEKYSITSIADAGAGDLHWIRDIEWNVYYRAYDLVPRDEEVDRWDITKDPLPLCDAILCRHVLIHFDPPRIERTLELFRQSAKYLFASQYDNHRGFDSGRQYNPTDLRKWLGEPLERIKDAGSDLALWSL